MKKIFVFFFVFLFSFGVAQDLRMKNAFGIDLGWSTEGFSNEGYGYGFVFERELFSFLSFKLRHGVVETWKQAVGYRVSSFVYSFLLSYNVFNKGLEGFSLSLGYGYDKVIVSDKESSETRYNFLVNFVDIMASYKFFVWERFLVDPYVEFMFPLGQLNREKTGIAMSTSYVNIIGINLGFGF